MKKDFQLSSPNTRVRKTVCNQLERLIKHIEQGLLTASDYAATVQPYTDRYCMNPQQRFVRGFCRLSIQAMLQKFIASLSHYGDSSEARQSAYLYRFRLLPNQQWYRQDVQQAMRVQQKLEQLLSETEQWPLFIDQSCLLGQKLGLLQQAMCWTIEQTARRLVCLQTQHVIDQLLNWNQVMQSLKRIREGIRHNQCADSQLQQMHLNLLRMIADTQDYFSPDRPSPNHYMIRQLIQKVDLSLWLDRLQWLNQRLDHYTRHQGIVRTAITWIGQYNRLMNIQRIISETQVAITRMHQWQHIPDSVKQSITQLESLVFVDLESVDNDMQVGAKLAQALNEETQNIKPG